MTTSKFEEILSRVETGPWNWLIFLLCSLWGVFGAMQAVASAFLSPMTDHWCHVPHLNHWTKDQRWNYTLPSATVGGVEQHAQCEMYARNYSVLEGVAWEDRNLYLPERENFTTVPCTSWEYDTSTFTSTLISEWDLVCGRESLRSLIQSIFMVGYFFGAPLGGYGSDRFGRKRLMSASLWCFIAVSVAGSFSPSYPLFLLCRLLMALTGTIVYQASYILAVEASSVRHRSVVGILFSVPFAVGFMLLPGLAYLIRDWRFLHLAISAPVILLIANTIILPESPRWLLQKGRWREATEELQRAARWNSSKTFDSAWLMATITELKAEAEEEVDDEDKKKREDKPNPETAQGTQQPPGPKQNETADHNNLQHRTRMPLSPSHASTTSTSSCLVVSGWRLIKKVFVFLRTPMLRRISLIMYFNWITCSMVYYGISLNSANFSVDPFLYMFLGGLMEIPSYTLTIPLVARLGRKISLIGFLVICGLAILVIILVPDERERWWFLTLVMVSKFSITSAYQVIYLYSSELYPTSLRTRGIGVSSMMGRLGAILSPFVNDILGLYHWAIPSTIFGLLSLSASLLTCFLPETNHRPLPDTVDDVEAWARKRETKQDTVALSEKEETQTDEKLLQSSNTATTSSV